MVGFEADSGLRPATAFYVACAAESEPDLLLGPFFDKKFAASCLRHKVVAPYVDADVTPSVVEHTAPQLADLPLGRTCPG